MSRIEELLKLAKEYGRAESIELSTVSWRVFGDTKKLRAIEAGADIQMRRYEGAIQWFSDHWPNTAKWPQGVVRPLASARAAS